MGKKIDRIGEERLNKFGSKMIIVKYNNTNDIDILFILNMIILVVTVRGIEKVLDIMR